jgi:nucleotidyltransferase-like protein
VNDRPARVPGVPDGPPLLAELRDRLLGQLLGLLEADVAIDGVALVGSLGRGEEDNWSDIDLFILASDQFIRQFMNEPAASPWARADLLSDGRHNSPAGATSLGTTHIRSGLPLWADLHVHPSDRTPWPADSRIVFERRPARAGTLSFGEFNASGPRQPATVKTADEVRRIHLGYVPIAGKYVGRRSPRAGEMIRFLGRRDFTRQDPAAQVLALRGIAKDLSSPLPTQFDDAVGSYLDLVEAAVKPARHSRHGRNLRRRAGLTSRLVTSQAAGRAGQGRCSGPRHRLLRRTSMAATARSARPAARGARSPGPRPSR